MLCGAIDMQRQVVKIKGKYAARVRRFRWCRWKYLGLNYTHTRLVDIDKYCLTDTIEEAKERFDWFGDFEVVLNAT